MIITNQVIKKELTHKISIEKMWWYWTNAEGLKSFFGEDNRIELKPFGSYEIYFSMDWPEGERGSEGCQVLSYIPNKMLSFTWNAPPKFNEIRSHNYKTWVVLEFEENKLTLTHLGWPEGQSWHDVYYYFDLAWTYVIEQLEKAISKEV